MLSTREFLEKCSKLKHAGLEIQFEQGMRVGRAFADLGFEEFYLITNSKIISLMTGNASTLQEHDLVNFFWIASVDELVNQIQLEGFDLNLVEMVEQRSWRVEAKSKERQVGSEASALNEALVELLLQISLEK